MFKRLLPLVLMLLAGCAAKPEFQRPSLLQTQHQRTGVFFTTETRPLTVSPWDIRYQNIGYEQDPKLLNYLALFEQEIAKLPPAVLRLSGLDKVAFVRALSVGPQPRAAVPDYIHEVLYYDVDAPGDAYLRHVVHHEFYHMLEQQLYGSAYYKDPLWHSLNPDGFVYGNGGAYARDSSVSVFSHPHPGFVNGYAMSGLEEDKAEIWAIIWAQQSWQAVETLVEIDSILQAKIRLLTAQVQCQAPEMANTWPDYIQRYLAALPACEFVDTIHAAPAAVEGS
ncbi:hypothetical protein GCM10009092_07550 [Bowmanella denitrificans]|uniref:Lipoprotein n=1 Tax=Bowmanella denitrificans TaxID=366582 RepID=A0ABN0WSP5_9ALTE